MAVKENGKWKGDELWQVPFNRKGMSVSNGCFSPDGKRFYFTIGRKDWKNRIVNAVYVSENRSGRWQQPSLIKEIRSRRHSCTHPAVASGPKPGQEILYFVSDRPGGRGGTDIWYTIHNIKRKTFTKPRNVGPQINTVGEEFTPFWDDSLKVLYFSSTGWPGYGGFDIFRAKGGTAGWTLPENMGPPVNSAVDDIYYTVKPASKEGLLVSNREGTVPLRHPTCCDDIFSFGPAADSLYPVKGAVAQVKDTSSIEAGLISQDMEPVSGAVVKLFRRDVKLNQEYLVMKDTTDNLGRYKLNIRKGNDYKLSIDKEGYFSFSTAFNSTDVLEGRDSSLRTISLRKATSQPIVVKNINYAFARYELTDSIKWILDRTLLKVLQDNPFLVIEIASHTDNIGGEKFNLELSEKRAGKVAEYLISKGISPDRLQTKGYGEHKPVAANSSGDGKDDPGGRAANRRTEFRITGWVKN
jgi:OmpA-OmpF porin, OOP family